MSESTEDSVNNLLHQWGYGEEVINKFKGKF